MKKLPAGVPWIAPAVGLLLALSIYPLIYSIKVSFTSEAGGFTAAHYAGTDPVADHYLMLKSDGVGGTQIWFDADGSGPGAAIQVTTVDHVAPAALTMQNDWFFH